MAERSADWNDALDAAIKAVQNAPIFPKKRNVVTDSERLQILGIIERQLQALKK